MGKIKLKFGWKKADRSWAGEYMVWKLEVEKIRRRYMKSLRLELLYS